MSEQDLLDTKLCTTATEVLEETRVLALRKVDSSHPSILSRQIDNGHWCDHNLLDHSKNNYETWADAMETTLAMSHNLIQHIHGAKGPNKMEEPCPAKNWESNDFMVLVYIKSKCEISEKKMLLGFKTAQEAWTFLKDRHECQGMGMSMYLMDKKLKTQFKRPNPSWSTFMEVKSIVKQVWENTPLNFDSFVLFNSIWLLHSSPGYSTICTQIVAELSCNSNLTLEDVMHMLEMDEDYQNMPNAGNHPSDIPPSSDTLAVASKDVNSCTNCKKVGHSVCHCIKKNGGLQGKSIVKAQNIWQAECKGKFYISNPSSHPMPNPNNPFSPPPPLMNPFLAPPPPPHNSMHVLYLQNHPYLIQPDGSCALMSSSCSPVPPSATLSKPALFGNSPSLSLQDSMTEQDIIEYMGTYPCFDLPSDCNLDWSLHSSPNPSLQYTSHNGQPVAIDQFPFILDSGCSIHISSQHSDFSDLQHIKNHIIHGVGSSQITATGVGTICLSLGGGSTLTLDNVLFIPNSTIRLISIACLINSFLCVVTFHHDSVNIVSQSRLFATGSHMPHKFPFCLTHS